MIPCRITTESLCTDSFTVVHNVKVRFTGQYFARIVGISQFASAFFEIDVSHYAVFTYRRYGEWFFLQPVWHSHDSNFFSLAVRVFKRFQLLLMMMVCFSYAHCWGNVLLILMLLHCSQWPPHCTHTHKLCHNDETAQSNEWKKNG